MLSQFFVPLLRWSTTNTPVICPFWHSFATSVSALLVTFLFWENKFTSCRILWDDRALRQFIHVWWWSDFVNYLFFNIVYTSSVSLWDVDIASSLYFFDFVGRKESFNPSSIWKESIKTTSSGHWYDLIWSTYVNFYEFFCCLIGYHVRFGIIWRLCYEKRCGFYVRYVCQTI